MQNLLRTQVRPGGHNAAWLLVGTTHNDTLAFSRLLPLDTTPMPFEVSITVARPPRTQGSAADGSAPAPARVVAALLPPRAIGADVIQAVSLEPAQALPPVKHGRQAAQPVSAAKAAQQAQPSGVMVTGANASTMAQQPQHAAHASAQAAQPATQLKADSHNNVGGPHAAYHSEHAAGVRGVARGGASAQAHRTPPACSKPKAAETAATKGKHAHVLQAASGARKNAAEASSAKHAAEQAALRAAGLDSPTHTPLPQAARAHLPAHFCNKAQAAASTSETRAASETQGPKALRPSDRAELLPGQGASPQVAAGASALPAALTDISHTQNMAAEQPGQRQPRVKSSWAQALLECVRKRREAGAVDPGRAAASGTFAAPMKAADANAAAANLAAAAPAAHAADTDDMSNSVPTVSDARDDAAAQERNHKAGHAADAARSTRDTGIVVAPSKQLLGSKRNARHAFASAEAQSGMQGDVATGARSSVSTSAKLRRLLQAGSHSVQNSSPAAKHLNATAAQAAPEALLAPSAATAGQSQSVLLDASKQVLTASPQRPTLAGSTTTAAQPALTSSGAAKCTALAQARQCCSKEQPAAPVAASSQAPAGSTQHAKPSLKEMMRQARALLAAPDAGEPENTPGNAVAGDAADLPAQPCGRAIASRHAGSLHNQQAVARQPLVGSLQPRVASGTALGSSAAKPQVFADKYGPRPATSGTLRSLMHAPQSSHTAPDTQHSTGQDTHAQLQHVAQWLDCTTDLQTATEVPKRKFEPNANGTAAMDVGQTRDAVDDHRHAVVLGHAQHEQDNAEDWGDFVDHTDSDAVHCHSRSAARSVWAAPPAPIREPLRKRVGIQALQSGKQSTSLQVAKHLNNAGQRTVLGDVSVRMYNPTKDAAPMQQRTAQRPTLDTLQALFSSRAQAPAAAPAQQISGPNSTSPCMASHTAAGLNSAAAAHDEATMPDTPAADASTAVPTVLSVPVAARMQAATNADLQTAAAGAADDCTVIGSRSAQPHNPETNVSGPRTPVGEALSATVVTQLCSGQAPSSGQLVTPDLADGASAHQAGSGASTDQAAAVQQAPCDVCDTSKKAAHESHPSDAQLQSAAHAAHVAVCDSNAEPQTAANATHTPAHDADVKPSAAAADAGDRTAVKARANKHLQALLALTSRGNHHKQAGSAVKASSHTAGDGNTAPQVADPQRDIEHAPASRAHSSLQAANASTQQHAGVPQVACAQTDSAAGQRGDGAAPQAAVAEGAPAKPAQGKLLACAKEAAAGLIPSAETVTGADATANKKQAAAGTGGSGTTAGTSVQLGRPPAVPKRKLAALLAVPGADVHTTPEQNATATTCSAALPSRQAAKQPSAAPGCTTHAEAERAIAVAQAGSSLPVAPEASNGQAPVATVAGKSDSNGTPKQRALQCESVSSKQPHAGACAQPSLQAPRLGALRRPFSIPRPVTRPKK